ncbi:MAG: hypothetical protein KQH67_06310 [Bacteroidetes bacterium]|nr:hypothetical protein [Bacteroidota bacterium]
MKLQIRNIILVAFTLIMTASCSVEERMAANFVMANNTRSILVFPAEFIFKVNQKKEILDSLNITDESKFDSVLYVHSDYLQHLNDSLFLANYTLGYQKELAALGYKVYNQDQTRAFLDVDTNAYVANIAQIEVEETLYDYRAGQNIYGHYYYYDFLLNAIVVNSWIELKEVDDNSKNEQLYFATDIITDDFEGDFHADVFAGQMRFVYNIDTLQTEALYNFAFLLGRKYASYTMDMLLNKYLDENVPDGKRSETYWRYDPYKNDFFPEEENKFIPMAGK